MTLGRSLKPICNGNPAAARIDDQRGRPRVAPHYVLRIPVFRDSKFTVQGMACVDGTEGFGAAHALTTLSHGIASRALFKNNECRSHLVGQASRLGRGPSAARASHFTLDRDEQRHQAAPRVAHSALARQWGADPAACRPC